jgi:hypothetical protein
MMTMRKIRENEDVDIGSRLDTDEDSQSTYRRHHHTNDDTSNYYEHMSGGLQSREKARAEANITQIVNRASN